MRHMVRRYGTIAYASTSGSPFYAREERCGEREREREREREKEREKEY